MRPPFTRRGFSTWLRAQQDDAVVGLACSHTSCPLATYLDELGWEFSSITTNICCVNGGYFVLPPWARLFIDLIDEGDWHGEVTAASARALLERL